MYMYAANSNFSTVLAENAHYFIGDITFKNENK